jgi:hypothetical protein
VSGMGIGASPLAAREASRAETITEMSSNAAGH